MKKTIIIATALMLLGGIAEAAAPTPVSFGSKFGKTFIEALYEAVDADDSLPSYVIEGVTVTPKKGSKIEVDESAGYVGKPLSISFTSAESGDAVLRIKASVSKKSENGNAKHIVILKNGKTVDKETMMNMTDARITDTFTVKVKGVVAGDVITIKAEDSSNHRIYNFSWNKAE